MQIQTVAVGWQVYDLTRDPFDLGLVGLVQFVPALLLVLVTGAAADRSPPHHHGACLAGEALCAWRSSSSRSRGMRHGPADLRRCSPPSARPRLLRSGAPGADPEPGAARAAGRAIALNSSAWQIAVIVGPVAGGLLYGVVAGSPMAGARAASPSPPSSSSQSPSRCRKTRRAAPPGDLLAGFRYIWREKIVLGAISLDLFAVLLGGATALLPVYARDILDVGPWGLGLLRSGARHRRVLVAVYCPLRCGTTRG